MQQKMHGIFENQQAINQAKPLGDDENLSIEESRPGGSNLQSFSKRRDIQNNQNPTKTDEKIDTEREYKIAKELLGIYEENVDENKKKFKIESQYLTPIFIFSQGNYQPQSPLLPAPSAITEQTHNKQDGSQIVGSNNTKVPTPNKDKTASEEGIDIVGITDKMKNNLYKNQQNLIGLHPLLSNQYNEEKQENNSSNNQQDQSQEEEQEIKLNKKFSQMLHQQPHFQPANNEELVQNNYLNQGQYQHPNQEIVEQMCERELTDIKVVGSIYMMLICLLTQFNMSNLATNLFFKFQSEIMQIDKGSQMFDVDLFSFIEANLNSVIYLNELIILGLRVQEFIPLLNLFLIVFQIRIHKVRKQIISAMAKKSLSTLEIIIGNYKKRMPKKKSKRKIGNQKIKRAMDLITTYYMKKGSIENEHELLIFVINEGYQQISVELLMYLIFTKIIPPELFITKKVVKQSLIELNIPMLAKAFRLRSKWVKSLFLTEKIFLHICQLVRCNETFAEGLYFLKKISQKKQRSSAPLWYTENVIELFEEIYTLNPVISAIIISKMLYKLSLNKNPLQVQLNRLSDYFKDLAIEFRDQITDERQMKMTLFKIVFPSDKTLIQITKTSVIYTYFNDFLQSELILKLLMQKYESSQHFDMNLLSASTSFNYLFNVKKLKTPYLHYNQKFEKVEEKVQLSSIPFINFNIKDTDSEQKKADKQFFGHILQQKIKSIGASIFKFKAMGNQTQPNQTQNLVKQYRAAIKKKKTIQFNNEQTIVKYSNQNKSENNNKNKGYTLNIFKEITPISIKLVSKINHFYQFNIYKKSLQVRSYLEMILYFAIFNYCMATFFQILDLTNIFLYLNTEYLNLAFGCPSDNLKAEILVAYQTYIPKYTLQEIVQYSSTNLPLFCSLYLEFSTGGLQKYMADWQDDCLLFMKNNNRVTEVTDNFNRSIYFIYLIPVGFIFKEIHSKIVKKRYEYDLSEYIDIFLVFLTIEHYFTNQKVMSYNNMQCTYPIALEMQNDLQSLIYVLTLILFCLFTKVFQFLSRTEKLGVFVKILNLTIKQVFSFLFIFMINILAFASLFYLLSSYRLQQYNTLPNSIRTLIATSLGTFDYNDMNLGESIIQTVFLYSTNVIIINLLIAILTKTYSDITEKSNVEYALILFEEYVIGKFDKNYSLMIAFPPPLNFYQILFAWVLFFQKLKDLNGTFIKIGYSVILIVVYVLFLGLNIVVVPFAWLKLIFSIIIYQYQSINLNIILTQRKDQNKKSCWKSYIWCIICQWLWIIFGLPYLLFHAIITDSITFIKSAYSDLDNKYQYNSCIINTPIPQRCYYLIKCQPQLIDYRFKSETIIQNFHLVQNFLKFKYLIKAAKKDQEEQKSGKQKILHNYFLKVLRIIQRRKNQIKQFNKHFEAEYSKQREILNDIISNEHTDQSFLAIMRTKQIYYSTEYWEKNKVTSERQSKFYNLAINPSIKHSIQVQQSLMRKVQSQNQNISQIRNIQKQMSNAPIQQQSSHNSLSKNQNNILFQKQQTQRKKLQTLYEQTDAE